MDMQGYEGIHAAYSRYYIQRIRFSATDPLIPYLTAAGHHIEPVMRFDGSLDHNTVVVDFYEKAPDGAPVADEDWTTWKQLDVLKMAQKHWADQSVSVTVYYRKEEIGQLKEWLSNNLKYLKTISFLCHNDHGFKQAPKEAISREQYEKLSADVTTLNVDDIGSGDDLDGSECAGGACPIK
jgi:ribonucleoside-triphosphate reductase